MRKFQVVAIEFHYGVKCKNGKVEINNIIYERYAIYELLTQTPVNIKLVIKKWFCGMNVFISLDSVP